MGKGKFRCEIINVKLGFFLQLTGLICSSVSAEAAESLQHHYDVEVDSHLIRVCARKKFVMASAARPLKRAE